MDAATATKILGVEPGDDAEKVRARYRMLVKRYHPDNLQTGSRDKFLLVYAAYLVIKAEQVGVDTVQNEEDLSEYTTYVRDRLNEYFDMLIDSFKRDLERVETATEEEISRLVDSADSLGELKRIVENGIKNTLLDSTAEIRGIIRRLQKRAYKSNSDYVFELFKSMYEARRKYWLLNLYRNPVVALEALAQFLLYLIRNVDFLTIKDLQLRQLLTATWLWVGLLAAGVAVLTVQIIMLNPRRQYLPPRFSVMSLQALIQETATGIGSGRVALGIGGAAGGILVGSMILPGPGTILGGLIGSLFAFFGQSLGEKKASVEDSLVGELRAGISQIERQAEAWAANAKEDIYSASVEGLRRNLLAVARKIGHGEILLLERKRR